MSEGFRFITPDNFSTTLFLVVVFLVLFAIYRGLWFSLKKAASPVNPALFYIVFSSLVYLVLICVVSMSQIIEQQPVPRLIIFFAFILMVSSAFAFSPAATIMLEQISLPWLVLFHLFRIPLEFAMHLWVKQGSVPETITWTGQNFDIFTGFLAILTVLLMKKSIKFVWAFNIIGILLLGNLMRVIVLSSPLPFAWRLDPPLLVTFHAPYVLLFPVCVGAALAGHILIFRALAARKNEF